MIIWLAEQNGKDYNNEIALTKTELIEKMLETQLVYNWVFQINMDVTSVFDLIKHLTCKGGGRNSGMGQVLKIYKPIPTMKFGVDEVIDGYKFKIYTPEDSKLLKSTDSKELKKWFKSSSDMAGQIDKAKSAGTTAGNKEFNSVIQGASTYTLKDTTSGVDIGKGADTTPVKEGEKSLGVLASVFNKAYKNLDTPGMSDDEKYGKTKNEDYPNTPVKTIFDEKTGLYHLEDDALSDYPGKVGEFFHS